MVDLFRLLSTLVSSLLSIDVMGMSMAAWFGLFWILAIVGWILQTLYGRGEK